MNQSIKNTAIFISIFALTIIKNNAKLQAQTIKYTSCNNCWQADSLGNHRFVVQLNQSTQNGIAHIMIPWRRRDNNPEQKRVIIEDAKTHQRIRNVKLKSIQRDYGDIFFQPLSGNGIYNVYYLPYKNEGRSNYPKGVYLQQDSTADAIWLSKINTIQNNEGDYSLEYQSIDAFNSFYPMEFTATEAEQKIFLSKNAVKDFIVIPEDRMLPIRMKYDLPMSWMQKDLSKPFAIEAKKGEYFTYQLGIYALQNLDNVQVQFSDLKSAQGNMITAKNMSCINTTGTTYDAKPLTKVVKILQNQIQALWCGIDVPVSTNAGIYIGTAIVSANGVSPKTVTISLVVNDKTVLDGGISEPEKQTRLKWLNSTLAQNNTIIAPYVPLKIQDHTLRLLGRKLILGNDGFPKQIQTFFTEEMTGLQTKANNILVKPIQLVVEDKNGKILWKNNTLTFTKSTDGMVQWQSSAMSTLLQIQLNASIEFDGFVSYAVKITASKEVSLKDIRLEIPLTASASTYMMGLNLKGGNRPTQYNWKWDVAKKNQDGAWLGSVNAGLQFSLRDEKYVRPLNTNFYLQKPLLLPSSWGNENKGGIDVSEKDDGVLVNNYSGERTMKKGDSLFYNFTLLITPFHSINTNFQWATRFYHAYQPIDSIKTTGATVINIHHANAINPYINYPFIEHKKMKAYIDSAHDAGLKVKIYNTVRELSNKAYEVEALRSLGHEIYSPGKGGGFSWLQEHVGDDYIAAWFVPELKDAAIVNSGMSRWHNYYVEGMNWLTQNVGIDGIYLDDVAFDRITMKRIKRVLTNDGHPGIIDLHSANQYNKNDGFNNSANLYMEHFPYLNRLWFGEYFDYEKNTPDFFMTEVSGIPFGLMGEMLQDGGNAWRGMIYGMTNRKPWSDNADPSPLWKVWDVFGMKGSEMIGYWSRNCPVKTNNDMVLATVYKKNNQAMVAIASWAETEVNVKLNIDWKKLCIDPSKATIVAPDIEKFQSGKSFSIKDEITIPKGKGFLLIIK
jgi:Family of unknown function (DUF6067)